MKRRVSGLIGVDIGSTAVKLVQLRAPGAADSPAPICAGAPVPPGAVADGLVARPVEVAAALAAALEKAGIGARDAVAAISGGAVVLRPASLPRMGRAELMRAAYWEAQRQIPLPLEDLVVDCAVCGEDAERAGMVDVIIAGAQRRAASALAATLVRAGLRPRALDADALAAYRALVALRPAAGAKDAVALLDVGAANSRLWLFGRRQLQVSRTIPVGVEQVSADFGSACQSLADGLRRSLEFFLLRGKRLAEDVFLLGGGAGLPGLAEALAELLAEGFAGRQKDSGRIAVSALDPGGGSAYALAFGLALWEGQR